MSPCYDGGNVLTDTPIMKICQSIDRLANRALCQPD